MIEVFSKKLFWIQAFRILPLFQAGYGLSGCPQDVFVVNPPSILGEKGDVGGRGRP
jgi:hypothetical protein